MAEPRRARLGVAAVVIVMAVAGVVFFRSDRKCDEKIVSAFDSSDGAWRATFLEGECTALSGIYEKVELSKTISGEASPETVYDADASRRGEPLLIQWLGPRQLEVSVSSDVSLASRREKVGDVAIRFVVRPTFSNR